MVAPKKCWRKSHTYMCMCAEIKVGQMCQVKKMDPKKPPQKFAFAAKVTHSSLQVRRRSILLTFTKVLCLECPHEKQKVEGQQETDAPSS